MIWPLPNPSRTFHAVCAYWLISSKGSRAQAPTHQASRNEDSATVSATGCRTHPPHTLSAHILSHLHSSGVILSAAVFQAERRISRYHAVCHGRSLGPLVKMRALRDDALD